MIAADLLSVAGAKVVINMLGGFLVNIGFVSVWLITSCAAVKMGVMDDVMIGLDLVLTADAIVMLGNFSNVYKYNPLMDVVLIFASSIIVAIENFVVFGALSSVCVFMKLCVYVEICLSDDGVVFNCCMFGVDWLVKSGDSNIGGFVEIIVDKSFVWLIVLRDVFVIAAELTNFVISAYESANAFDGVCVLSDVICSSFDVVRNTFSDDSLKGFSDVLCSSVCVSFACNVGVVGNLEVCDFSLTIPMTKELLTSGGLNPSENNKG